MMTEEEFEAAFNEKRGDFEQIANKRSQRPDLHAFILLDSLCLLTDENIVASAEHDQIWLGVDEDQFAKVATPELIKELRACGVFYEPGCGLSMFV